MRKALIALLFLFPLLANAASPQGDIIYKYVPQAKLVGQGVYKKIFWDIYKAMLFAPNREYTGAAPYALSITYFADIKGKDIAERSVDEMKSTGVKDQQKLSDWGAQMADIFPNVQDGSNLTAIATDDGKTLFLSEGKVIGTVEDKDFAPAFFGIWLKPTTADKNLRAKLLGQPQ
jgi:hypothetical protein